MPAAIGAPANRGRQRAAAPGLSPRLPAAERRAQDRARMRVMTTEPRSASPIPDKPTLDGIEDKWLRAWEMGRVVQV